MLGFSMINEHLFVAAGGAISDQKLKENGISLIINATNSMDLYSPRNTRLKTSIHVIRVPLKDNSKETLFPYLKPTAKLIRANEELGGKTLVHCQYGKSRSVALCMGYLIMYEKSVSSGKETHFDNRPIKVEEALQIIKAKRFLAQPNDNFLDQLYEFRLEVLSKKLSEKDTSTGLTDSKAAEEWMMKRILSNDDTIDEKKFKNNVRKFDVPKRTIRSLAALAEYLKNLKDLKNSLLHGFVPITGNSDGIQYFENACNCKTCEEIWDFADDSK